MTPNEVAQIIELRRAGFSPARIASQLGVELEAVEEAISDTISHQSVDQVRRLELDRLERLQQAVWTKAIQGDAHAVDRAVRLSELRLRLAGAPLGGTPMSEAFDATVEELTTERVDTALIEAGRWVVRQIDAAANSGDPATEAKAVFMVPHLVNVLRELGATPATREDMKRQAEATASSDHARTENDLDRFKKRRQTARPAGM